MNRPRRWIDLVAVAMFVLPTAVFAGTEPVPAEEKPTPKADAKSVDAKKARPDAKKLEQAKIVLATKREEVRALSEKATDTTIKLGELVGSGKPMQDQEAMDQMKKMVEELSAIKEMLQKIQEEVEAINGWIEGQNEALPILTQDVFDLKRNRVTNYIQFQYRDTDQLSSTTPFGPLDSFRLRRVRLGFQQTIDPKTSIRMSLDVAASGFGTQNQPADTRAELRDAILVYDIEPSDVEVGAQLNMGQMALPLGYELERSSGDREFPERAQYNLVLFPGERSRGVNFKLGTGKNSFAQVGVFNALTFNDSEQRGIQGSPGNRLGVTAGYRVFGTKFDAGVSYFKAKRQGFQVGWTGTARVNAPDVDREFLYLDATLIGFLNENLFFRAEGMIGKDRAPLTFASTSSGAASGISNPNDVRLKQKDQSGYQFQVGYNISSRNQLNFRYATYDPDKDVTNNMFREYGVAYLYYINPGARLTIAHEIFEDPTRARVNGVSQQRYSATTVRMQFRF